MDLHAWLTLLNAFCLDSRTCSECPLHRGAKYAEEGAGCSLCAPPCAWDIEMIHQETQKVFQILNQKAKDQKNVRQKIAR